MGFVHIMKENTYFILKLKSIQSVDIKEKSGTLVRNNNPPTVRGSVSQKGN